MARDAANSERMTGRESAAAPPRRGMPLAVAGTLAFLALIALPAVHDHPRVAWTFAGVGALLLAWEAVLVAGARRGGRTLVVIPTAVRAHYVQASVQFTILLYWGWYARENPDVYAELPLILGQVLYLYLLDALLSWTRGRPWTLGFGPLPIIFSTNLLLWFRDDWFYLQFAMVTLGALGKHFVTWTREGRRTHIFNPSVFGQFIMAVALISTGTSKELTWGREIAGSFDVPHMLVVLFLLGLVVQYLFHVTLVTLAAASAICLVNVTYHQVTGSYYFVNTNFAAPIFLGIHLLITDPATSPRTNVGRVVFGFLYGLAYSAGFWILDFNGVPQFWDKLLPVPALNLGVPLLDRFARSGFAGRINARWEAAMQPAALNLVHMGCWAALFATMLATGYIEAPHPGNSIPYWRAAYAEGKPLAGRSLIMAAGFQAVRLHSPDAYNELGLICMEGKIIHQNRAGAAQNFAKAVELGSVNACANVAMQFLFLKEKQSDEDVARALGQLERIGEAENDSGMLYLVAFAYESGRGRTADRQRAIALYERSGLDNPFACKGLARIGLSSGGEPYNLAHVAPTLIASAKEGDAESCWYLAHMHHDGNGVPRDEAKAREMLHRASELGCKKAIEAEKSPAFPPFSKPTLIVPGWSSAFGAG